MLFDNIKAWRSSGMLPIVVNGKHHDHTCQYLDITPWMDSPLYPLYPTPSRQTGRY